MTQHNQFTDEGGILLSSRHPMHCDDEDDEAGFLPCIFA
jgi:hypothetical protein